jgi:hypothetical protein
MKHGEKWIQAKVLHKHQSPRSYVIENEQRQKYRRNRRHLRPSKLSEKEQRRDVKHSNTKEPSVSSDKARATAKNAIGQSSHGSIDSQHNPVITRSGRASKPPETEYLINN